jgi:IS5 family transposase
MAEENKIVSLSAKTAYNLADVTKTSPVFDSLTPRWVTRLLDWKGLDKKLKEKNIIPQIIERAFRDNPLTNKQKENNRIKSKTRCRVEHAFGFVTNSMNDFKIRSIGLRKAKGIIGLVNLVYNMCRYEQIIRLNLLSIKN